MFLNNNSFQTTTDASGSNGDYIQLPSLDSLAKSNFTIEVWFRVSDKSRSFQRIFEAGTQPGNNVLSIGFHATSGQLFINGDRMIGTPNTINNNQWYHVAMVKNNGFISTYINGESIDTYSFRDTNLVLSTCKIGAANYNNASTIGQFQEFRIWSVAKTSQEIRQNYRFRTLPNSPNLLYYLPLTKDSLVQLILIPNNTILHNASTTVGSLNRSATIISHNGLGARYFYDATRQLLLGTLSAPLVTNDTLEYSIDAGFTWTKVDTIINNQWVATLPTSFRSGTIQMRINNEPSRLFTNFTFSIDTIFNSITTHVVNGSISPTQNVFTDLSSYRVTYSGNSSYYIDSIYVNGVYDPHASLDSNTGYTFYNILVNQAIHVVYTNQFKLKQIKKGVLRAGDTLIVRSDRLESIILKKFNDSFVINNFKREAVFISDTNYYFILPNYLSVGTYSVTGVSGVARSVNTFAITIYNFGTDSVTIYKWGENGGGQLNVPDVRTLVQLAAGRFFAVALQKDGSVLAWGNNSYGELVNTPTGENDFVQISAGSRHSLALRSNGTVVAWGNNFNQQINVPQGLNNVVQVEAGPFHSIALKSDGTIVAWGPSGNINVAFPANINHDLVQLSSGYGHSLGIKNDSTVVIWGFNSVLQYPIPQGLSGVVQVKAGSADIQAIGGYSIALKKDGTVVGWGINDLGEIDQPPNLRHVTQIANGAIHTLCLLQNGTIVGFGYNNFGSLNIPPNIKNAVQVSSGCDAYFSFVISKVSVQTIPTPHGSITDTTFVKYNDTFRVTYAPNIGYVIDSIFIDGVYDSIVTADSLTGYTFKGIKGNPTFKVTYRNQTFRIVTSTNTGGVINVVGGNIVKYDSTAVINVVAQSGYIVDSIWKNGNLYYAFEQGRNIGSNINSFSLLQVKGDSSIKAWFRSITPSSAPVIDSVIADNASGKLYFTSPNNFGGAPILYYKIYTYSNSDTLVSTATTEFFTAVNLMNKRDYTFKVSAVNIIGESPLSAMSLTIRPFNPFQKDSILFLSNNSFQTTTVGSGQGGDYIQLPALDMSGNFTIETWFKSNVTVGGWERIFDFGKSINGNGTSEGVLLGFPTATQLGFHVNGSDSVISFPSGFNPLNWNHYALVWNGSSVNLYINGVLTSSTSAGQQDILPGTCVSNYIGRSNWNDLSTKGFFNTFRIWKTAKTTQEIQQNYKISVLNNTFNLYYYLPLNKKNLVQTVTIPNGTKLNNASMAFAALNDSAMIISQTNIGARYFYDTNRQFLYGSLSDTIPIGQHVQYSLNGGQSWHNVDTVIGYYWLATLPPSFKFGRIQVRLNNNPNRFFNDYVFNFDSVFSSVNTSVVNGYIESTPKIFSGSNYRVTYAPFPPYSLDSVYINGVYNANASRDSVTGYTFYNVLVNPSLKVVFKVKPFSVSPVTPQVQAGKQLMVRGQTIDKIVLRRDNDSSEIGYIHKEAIMNTLDTIFYFTIPASSAIGLYYVQAIKDQTRANNRFLINVYNFGADSVGYVAWGATFNGLNNIPTNVNLVQISGGIYYNIGLKTDGTLVGWGGNSNRELNITYGLDQVVQISSNSTHTLALRSNGEVWAFGGTNLYGQTTVPATLNNVIEVAAGTNFSLALKNDGTVVGWGASGISGSGNTPVPASINNIKHIATASGYSLALKNDGTLTGWGNIYGPYNIPSGLNNIEQISVGGNDNIPELQHSIALKNDGSVSVWGSNDKGQLNVPANLNNVRYIVAGINHSLALKKDGTIVAWGSNGYGQLNIPFNIQYGVAIFTGSSSYGSYAFTKIAVQTRAGANGVITPTTFVKRGDNFRVTYQPNLGYQVDSIFINNSYDARISTDSLTSFTFYNLTGASPTIRVTYRIKTFTISTRANTAGGTISVMGSNKVNYGSNATINIRAQSGYIIDSIWKDTSLYYRFSGGRSIGDTANNFSILNVRGDSSVTVSFKRTAIATAPTIDSVFAGNAIANLYLTSPTNFGGVPILYYKIYRYLNNDTIISTSTTLATSIQNLVNRNKYSFQVSAVNVNGESGLSAVSDTIIPFNPFQKDSILYYSNNNFQTTSSGSGGAGDYVQLPSLDMSGNFTIETWFKANVSVSSWERIFDFGKSINGNGTSEGVLLGFPNSNQFGFHVNGSDLLVSFPLGYNPLSWNHYALVWNGISVSLYINGVLISSVSNGQQNILPSTCVSNFIGRSNWNDVTTKGLFNTFRIWKVARTAQEIQQNYDMNVLTNTVGLYYYLPLYQNNQAKTMNINNNTILNNASTADGALVSNSTIISQNNTGAQYVYDSTKQELFGSLLTPLDSFETILYSIDNGYSWEIVDRVTELYWYATLPASFKTGTIKVKSSTNSNRIFKDYIVMIPPQNFYYSHAYFLDTFLHSGNSVIPHLEAGSNVKYCIISGGASGIDIDSMTGVINWTNAVAIGNYNLTIQASNNLGTITTQFFLKVAKVALASSFQYNPDDYTGTLGVADSTALPAISSAILQKHFTIAPNNLGVSINPSTGRIIWRSTTPVQSTFYTITADFGDSFAIRTVHVFIDYPVYNYRNTNTQQTFTVPANVYLLYVEAVGASGGCINDIYELFSPPGGRVRAYIKVTPGETLNLFVGGSGQDNTGYSGRTFVAKIGGYNGGGSTQRGNYSYLPALRSAAGGGATDIRRGGVGLNNRIIVAGGGGGQGASFTGGGGGGLVANGSANNTGGGSQSSGGKAADYTYGGATGGSFGEGGLGTIDGGGGGGGWYGGGGGDVTNGGGGSSYFIPTARIVINEIGVNGGAGYYTIDGSSFTFHPATANGYLNLKPFYYQTPNFYYPNAIVTVNNYISGQSEAPVSNQPSMVFKILNPVNGIAIDTVTGIISWNNTLPSGNYILNVKGYTIQNDSFTNTLSLYVTSNNKDSIYTFRNATIKLSTNANGGGGDYIALPALEISNSNYTIETWFKNDGVIGNNSRIFDFGQKTGANGANSGVILAFANSTQLYFHSNSNENVIANLPANFISTNWNHFALRFSGNSLSLFLNGILIANRTYNQYAIAPNILVSNFIGRSNWDADKTTVGRFQDFRIWKRALSNDDISAIVSTNTPIDTAALYYYLPLNKTLSNNTPIQNNTQVFNEANTSGQLNSSATIISKNSTGASYSVNFAEQTLEGSLSDKVQPNEVIQYSVDSGVSWYDADTAFLYNWKATMPNNFYGGLIKVRTTINNTVTTRFFKDFVVSFLPMIPRIDSVVGLNSAIFVYFTPNPATLCPSITKYTVTGSKPNLISIDVASPIYISGLTNDSPYTFTMTATNIIGTSAMSNPSLVVKPTNTFDIILTEVVNGTISPKRSVHEYSSYRITYNPISFAYTLDSIFINGVYNANASLDSITGYTFDTITTNKSIKVIYKLKTFTITTLLNDGGRIIFNDGTNMVRYANSAALSIMSNTGYYIDSVLVNNNLNYAFSGGQNIGDSTFKLTIQNITGDSLVRVVFKQSTISTAPSIDTIIAGNAIATIYAFLPESLGGAKILFYKIYAYSNAGNRIDTVNNFPATLHGLTNDSSYVFKISAVNQNGESPLSALSDSIVPDPNLYNIITHVVNGTILDVKDNMSGIDFIVSHLLTGDSVTFDYYPNNGYKLDSIVVDSVKVDISLYPDSFKFVNIMRNHTIAVYYSIIKFRVRSMIGNNGSININNDTLVDYNSSLSVSFIPNYGYKTDSLFVNNIYIANDKDLYKIQNIQNDITLRVSFILQTYLVQATANFGGIIMPDGLDTVDFGSTPIYNFIPNTGYVVDSVFVNDIFVTSANNFTFDSVKTNQTIRVIFKLQNFIIMATAGMGGSIDPQGTSQVDYGTRPTYTFHPQVGYLVDSVFVNNTFVTTSQSYTFDSIKTNQTIYVSFKQQIFTISTKANNGGTIQLLSDTFATYGSNKILNIIPSFGNTLRYIVINNSVVSFANQSIDTPYLYTIENITQDLNIMVVFGNKSVIILSTENEGGTIQPNGLIVLSYDTSQQFIYSPNRGYELDSVIINGTRNVDSLSSYTFNNIRTNQMIRIIFKQQRFNIISSAGENGSINPLGIDTIQYDSNITYSFIPNIGYEVDSVFVNDRFATTNNSYTFDSVRFNQTIRVTFKNKTFTIMASAGNGGNVNPNGDTLLKYDSSIRYVFTPNTGYEIDSVFVNDTFATTENFYRFDSVRLNQTLRVTFKLKTFTINAITGNGGSISPSGLNIVNYGASITYTITPNDEFDIDSIWINNELINNVSEYTFNNVTNNQTIRVVFKRHSFRIIYSNNEGGTIGFENGSDIVLNDSNTTCIIKAMDTFIIDSIVVNGRLIYKFVNGQQAGLDSLTYRFDAVTGDSTINVSFRRVEPSTPPVLLGGFAGNGQAIVRFNLPTNWNGGDVVKYVVVSTNTSAVDSGTESPVIVKNLSNNLAYKFTVFAVNAWGQQSLSSDTTDLLFPQSNIVNINTQVINGTISESTAIKLGDSITITYRPQIGYELDSIFVNEEFVGNDSIQSYTFYNVQNETSILVRYKLKTFNIEALSTLNGTISPSGISHVGYGKNMQFSIIPNQGYALDSLFIDGKNVPNSTQFLFTNIMMNHTIFAKFKQRMFTIAINSGANGIVTPFGNIKVLYDSNVSVKFVPNIGYQVDSVLVNGVLTSVFNNEYIFNRVQGDSSLWVNFKPISVPSNTITIRVTNPNCYGLSGQAVLDFIDTTIYNKISVRNTITNNTQIYTLNARSFTVYGLYADSLYEINVYDSTPNTGYSNRIFSVMLSQPSKISAFSQLSTNNKQLTLNLSGSNNYTVLVNGKTYQTSSNNLNLPLSNGVNKIVVKTENACQGIYEETILVSETLSLYPNPTSNQITLNVGGSETKLQVRLVTEQGRYLFSKEVILDNYRNVVLDLSGYPAGVYLLKVNGTTVQGTLKLIKQ
ncbi:MAG: glycine-rich protein [Alphaproteobacteria bacterium]|nr:glycine-rich protein [Alphaproteobacteria bacterium]